jgi:hypothetical protein
MSFSLVYGLIRVLKLFSSIDFTLGCFSYINLGSETYNEFLRISPSFVLRFLCFSIFSNGLSILLI